jgi:beta-xylosidase
MDIHDGNTIRIGNTFYWYGAGYGDCIEMSTGCASLAVGSCGFNLNHTVNLATSTDLIHWIFHGAVLTPEDRAEGILFSPWVTLSKSTGLYVLWFNLLPVIDGHGDFDHSYYSVATSRDPRGPFTVVHHNVTGLAYNQLPDAASIFVDDDGQGYIAFTHEDTHINHVQQLTPDLLGPLPNGRVSQQIGDGNNEGILMFKREKFYYIMFGPCCCFCEEGSPLQGFIAMNPLGPYTSFGYVATSAAVWKAQTGSVWWTGMDWVLYGDRWQSAPDKIKGHDFSYWTPLKFNADGSVVPIQWEDQVTIRY